MRQVDDHAGQCRQVGAKSLEQGFKLGDHIDQQDGCDNECNDDYGGRIEQGGFDFALDGLDLFLVGGDLVEDVIEYACLFTGGHQVAVQGIEIQRVFAQRLGQVGAALDIVFHCEDQVAHVEMTREVARRFNHIYGREVGFEDKVEAAIKKMGKKNAKLYNELRRKYQEQGDDDALQTGQALLENQQNITLGDKERLFGYLEGSGRMILPEPDALLTPASKMPGLDGQKMSKSYANTISLREDPDQVAQKLRTMPTDPARVRRSDPGDPEKCPVWKLHQVYSNDEVRSWVQEGCQSAGIGCLDCKGPIIDAIQAELAPIHERAQEYEKDLGLVRKIIHEGNDKARDVARQTLTEVRQAMGLEYR